METVGTEVRSKGVTQFQIVINKKIGQLCIVIKAGLLERCRVWHNEWQCSTVLPLISLYLYKTVVYCHSLRRALQYVLFLVCLEQQTYQQVQQPSPIVQLQQINESKKDSDFFSLSLCKSLKGEKKGEEATEKGKRHKKRLQWKKERCCCFSLVCFSQILFSLSLSFSPLLKRGNRLRRWNKKGEKNARRKQQQWGPTDGKTTQKNGRCFFLQFNFLSLSFKSIPEFFDYDIQKRRLKVLTSVKIRCVKTISRTGQDRIWRAHIFSR